MAAFALGYLGDPNNRPDPETLGHSVVLQPPASETNNGFLVDGSAAGKISEGDLRGMLDSGKPVGFTEPNDGVLANLRKLTGLAPQTSVPFIVWRKQANGAYHCSILPEITLTGGGAGDEGATTNLPTTVRSATTTIGDAFTSRLAAAASSGMIPPAGTYYGLASTTVHLGQSIPYPEFNNKPDDKTVKTYLQSASGSYQLDVHVYWVNGASDDAYYFVVAHQWGSIFAGSMLADGNNNQGFFQGSLLLNISASGRIAESYSPSTMAKGGIVTNLQRQMLLWGLTQNGVGPLPFTAVYGNQIEWPNWAMLDLTHDIYCAWRGYQSDVWNVLQHPPETWSGNASFAGDLFLDNGHVRPMPEQSKGAIAFDVISSFVVRPPASWMPNPVQASAPPESTIQIASSVSPQLLLFHNKDGCLGARGHHERNVFWRSASAYSNQVYDLQRIAVKVG